MNQKGPAWESRNDMWVDGRSMPFVLSGQIKHRHFKAKKHFDWAGKTPLYQFYAV